MLCFINIYIKDALVVLLEVKKGITITNAFKIFLNKSDRKPNKILVDQGSKFYNTSFKSRLHDHGLKYIQHKMKENLLLILRDFYQNLKKQDL